jgi:hypothetical protein
MLNIPTGITMVTDVFLDINPESQYQINNNGRTHGDKRGVNKI